MRRLILAAAFGAALAVPLIDLSPSTAARVPAPQAGLAMPGTIQLATKSKLGPVTFNHADHVGKNFNVAGNGPIACTECHHTAQPASALTGNALLKTAWPADRTTTLSADLVANNAAAVGDIVCVDCHARSGETPKTLPAIPTIQPAGSAVITVTNQVAFHRNCGSCHEQVLKSRPDAKSPSPQKCSRCHSK